MRKISFLSVILASLCFSAFAQNATSITDVTGGQNQVRELQDLTCPEGSAYSQLPDGINGWTGNFGYVFYDNILSLSNSNISSVTFFLIESVEYIPLYMDIIVKEDNGGVPGNIKYSYSNVPVTVVPTGEFSFDYPVVTATYIFPSPIHLVSGDWIGYYAFPITGAGEAPAHHYWMTSSDGDEISYFDEETLLQYGNDFSFCLGSESNSQEIPLSGWAIFIGIVLILTFTVIRLRKSA
jgi:hypothetical protein